MPLSDPVPLQLRPGIYTNETDRGAKGRFKAGDRVRFFMGLAQSIGGWELLLASAIEGKARGMHAWISLSRAKLLAIGTSIKLYLINGTTAYNITPFDLATDLYGGALTELTDPFETTNGSATIVVNHAAHGRNVGDRVFYTASSPTFHNITLAGEYTVLTTPTANKLTIAASTLADATDTTNGGTVDFGYEIGVGQETESSGLGWGAGPYGAGTYGTARSETTIRLAARTWSIDNWGEDGVFNPRGGAIYLWEFNSAFDTRAVVIADAPALALTMCVSPIDRHMLVGGAHDGSALDPMLWVWSSSEDFTDFTPSAINTAGDIRLDEGSEILQQVKTRQEILVITDETVYGMYFAGPPDIFGSRSFGLKCGGVGPKCGVDFGGTVYWMGQGAFWKYDGAVQMLPCDVQTDVFPNLNKSQAALVYAGTNSDFMEVTWFWPRGDATELTDYVTLCLTDASWSLGTLARTCWIDKGEFATVPIAVDPDGFVFVHETGTDDNGAAMDFSIETYDFDAVEGAKFIRLQQMLPDFDRLDGTVELYIKTRRKPQAAQVTKGPFSLTDATEYLRTKARGMQMAFMVTGTTVGAAMRMGTWRARFKPFGKK